MCPDAKVRRVMRLESSDGDSAGALQQGVKTWDSFCSAFILQGETRSVDTRFISYIRTYVPFFVTGAFGVFGSYFYHQ
jgi:hypothetical protein